MTSPQFLVVGQVVRAHGVRGELRVKVLTDYPERLLHLDEVALSRIDTPSRKDVEFFDVELARPHQDHLILKLSDLNDRDEADRMRGHYIMVALEDAVPLEDDEYYHFQLIGLTMVTDQGQVLGQVAEILETGANDVYIVRGEAYGELLIPAIESVIQKIDLDAKQITITPLEGLLPDSSA